MNEKIESCKNIWRKNFRADCFITDSTDLFSVTTEVDERLSYLNGGFT